MYRDTDEIGTLYINTLTEWFAQFNPQQLMAASYGKLTDNIFTAHLS